MSFNLYASLEYLLWEEFYLKPSEHWGAQHFAWYVRYFHGPVCSRPKNPRLGASLVVGGAEHSPPSLAGPKRCVTELGGFNRFGKPLRDPGSHSLQVWKNCCSLGSLAAHTWSGKLLNGASMGGNGIFQSGVDLLEPGCREDCADSAASFGRDQKHLVLFLH